MKSLEFDFEWIDPAAAKGAELRATWARFSLRVGNESLMHAYDRTVRSVRECVYLPLYPLAEWLATNWWFLSHEVETPGRAVFGDYARRHDLRFAREGFALPPLIIVPRGDVVQLRWYPERLHYCKIDFLNEGAVCVSLAAFRANVSDFVRAVIERLEQSNVTETLLSQEWRAIESTPFEEEAFCAAAAALGRDPYSLDESTTESIVHASTQLPQSVLEEFFAAGDCPSLLLQSDRLLRAISETQGNNADLKSLKKLRAELSYIRPKDGSPWDQGYEIARTLRRRIGLNEQPLADLASVADALGLSSTDLTEAILPTQERPDFFDAVVGVNSHESPGFVVGGRRSEAQRFAFCRGLFEYLTARTTQPSVVTHARSDRQQRNRAFAAEFLLPAPALRDRVRSDVIGEEDLEDLATEFGVSAYVVRHQLQNHRIAHTVSG